VWLAVSLRVLADALLGVLLAIHGAIGPPAAAIVRTAGPAAAVAT
jgi:hypothetical protein